MTPEERAAWHAFQDCKALWWINRSLHLLGWAIVYHQVPETGEIVRVVPERVAYRGFDAASDAEGFIGLTRWMRDQAAALVRDVEE